MFNYIYLNNIAGINNEIKLDFRATPRKKEKKTTVCPIDKGISLNKIAGIIGGNASGKTSIIKAICAVGSFIGYRKMGNSTLKFTSIDDIKIENDIYYILPQLSDNSPDSFAEIEMDMYISKGKKTGFYTYMLKYTLNPKADIKSYERLEFRKKFNDVKKIIFDIKQTKLESELGYKYNYRENILADYEKTDKKVYEAIKAKLEYYETFYEHYVDNSDVMVDGMLQIPMQYFYLLNWLKKDEYMVNKTIKIIDKKVDKITIEENNDTHDDEIVLYGLGNKKLSYSELSTGTKKALYLINRALKVISNESVLLCDEIDNSLHMDLIKMILRLFILPDSKAQIIFTTNNENVLDEAIIRNDQIYCIARDNEQKINVNKYSEMPEVRYDSVFKINYRRKNIYSEQPNDNDINNFISYISEIKF
ncbi:MAG: ATP-binding protein [Clostridia bacterium]|nr:ATP-binding protein [Clostridia bacterium]